MKHSFKTDVIKRYPDAECTYFPAIKRYIVEIGKGEQGIGFGSSAQSAWKDALIKWRVEAMSKIPQDVIDHCNAHSMCKGCPLGTCTAPLVNYGDERWSEWVSERIKAIQQLPVNTNTTDAATKPR